jgi:hypothetical protein
MSENTKLTSEQSKIVRELSKAVEGFGNSSTYSPDALRKQCHKVAEKFRELEAAFPEAAKAAAEYYQSDLPEEPEEQEGYGDALFNLLLDLQAFYDAEGFNRVASTLQSLQNSVYDLSTFSDEYNVERGFWNEEIEAWEVEFRLAEAEFDK